MARSELLRQILDKHLDLVLFHLLDPFDESFLSKRALTTKQLAALLSITSYQDVVSFRLVNRKFNHVYKLRFSSFLLGLPSEIHEIILGYLVHTNTDGKLMPTEKKASLSVESFAVHQPSPEDSNQTANYRLVCRDFAERALRCQFTRIWTRFSENGFERLRFVADHPHLAKTVKQFSYIIPRFYTKEDTIFEEISQKTRANREKLQKDIQERRSLPPNQQRPTILQLQSRLARNEVNEHQILQTMLKAQEQTRIIKGRIDFQTLLFALKAFVNLEQVRFMKIVDQVDAGWTKLLEQHPRREELNTEWNFACEHSANALTEALIKSNPPNFQRLSSRFVDPTTPLSLTSASNAVVSLIARKLKSLEIEFDNRWNLDEKVLELSPLFNLGFTEAHALENLHVGFRRLVSVPISTVFHDVRLDKLSYLGLHQWQLEASELSGLLLRYRHIKYLRLRYICLRKGSWGSVLKTIRLNLTLNWISLRGVCYPNTNPQLGGLHHVALGHGPDESDEDSDPDDWTGSGDEDTEEMPSEEDDSQSNEEVGGDDTETNEEEDDVDAGDEGDGSDDEGSMLGNEPNIGLPPINLLPSLNPFQPHHSFHQHQQVGESLAANTNDRRPRRSSHVGQCHCLNGYAWDKLDDNRAIVQEIHWKRWQKWALKPCRVHDAEAAALSAGDGESDDDE